MNKYYRGGINFQSEKDDWKKYQKNNVTVALCSDVLYAKKEKIYPAYVSNHNSNCEKQVTLLMIPNGEMSLSCSKKTISIIKKSNV